MTFLPDASTMVAFSIACFVLFITPGPDMSLFLSRTIAGGRRFGVASAIGANVGCVVHTTLAALGVSALIAASATAFTVLKVVGAGYLLWLAFDAIRNGSALTVREGARVDPSVWRSFVMGVGVNLTNPKIILFFVTFLPQFVDAHDPHASQKLLFLGLFFVLTNIPLTILMILGAERLVSALKRRPSVLRAIDYVFAGVFGVFAARILMTQTR
ncbi:MAG: threonine transporter RhtB [Rhizobiales bacterium 65-9]|nr:LysE family translocator [Hyphomicrobiales bacterium]OJY36514.1 MAG: threonine transporter RhtB [Rhizobiales bacterium 65-9]